MVATRATSRWTADPEPSYHALEGQFSGGQAYTEGWNKTREAAAAREKIRMRDLELKGVKGKKTI